jgi:nicotinic acid mononucleotide adenylyltransferase
MSDREVNNEDTIILTIGRMNPPTTGHLLLIKEMINKAVQDNLTQINIVLSHSVDKKKNPFACEDKRFFLTNDIIHPSMTTLLKKQMMETDPVNADKIKNVQVKIICMDDYVKPEYGKHPIMKSIGHILGEFYAYPRENLKIKLIVGQDRMNDYDWIKKFLETQTDLNPVNVEIVGLPRPEGAMSATEMRNYALNNDWETFKTKLASTGLDESVIRSIFDGIIINMTQTPEDEQPKKKKTRRGGRKKYKNRKTKRNR